MSLALFIAASISSATIAPIAPIALIAHSSDPILACPSGKSDDECSVQDVINAISIPKDLNHITTGCIYEYMGHCASTAKGLILGAPNHAPAIWVQMLLLPKDGPQVQMTILLDLTLLDEPKIAGIAQSSNFLNPPYQIYDDDQPTLIHIEGRQAGTAYGNADMLYQYKNAAWRPVDIISWIKEAEENIPEGFEMRKDIKYNFREMMASSLIWRDGDGNCCATGGDVYFDFDIKGDMLSPVAMSFNEAAKGAPQTKHIMLSGHSDKTEAANDLNVNK
ncbi:hypothetical protein LPB140_09945 [Sphingorhabdus lutea]|uniref:Uncharacterized protein n=1 Tax=Sphingorhabdus lutea TaxID=1913578 RepID=A0A1L3JD49_9SPHN|nr:hypothetical protein [Sphingorhabdus lutea]APG63054.1 hypothetical protein LPB140_09945 [Sphingorhabdus lutea]